MNIRDYTISSLQNQKKGVRRPPNNSTHINMLNKKQQIKIIVNMLNKEQQIKIIDKS